MFKNVLIANRGEIAVRIARTLRTMGVRSVVVASVPDRRGLAVRSADAMVLLEGYSAAETYLDIDLVIAAAKQEGCDAIHPGYGFLSERADFAERCAAEGIVFIGPPPTVLRALGDKSAARQLAVANGVPVVPGWDGADDDETLLREAVRIGAPLMVKARGGGGGRGMREVHDLEQLPEALASARREAQASFGDRGLLLERLVTDAHHVEIQVLADAHGNLIHLGERDCSVQRRRQKLIEESPSPIVDPPLRDRLTEAALRIARAVDYVNAGTVEFLVGPPGADGERPFYFMEVNPRLQVEHPVTEMVTGLDLVELQLRVAAGEPLPMMQEDVTFTGHAIEFRINAEDPWNDFRPSSGLITGMNVSVELGRNGPIQDSRDDEGYDEGDTVPTQYDSLILKRIVHGRDRGDALRVAANKLTGDVEGLLTNSELHRSIVTAAEFTGGEADIGWLERSLDEIRGGMIPPAEWVAAGGLGLRHMRNEFFPMSRSPATERAQWLGAGETAVWLNDGRVTREVRIHDEGRERATVSVDGVRFECTWKNPRLGSLKVGTYATPIEASIGYHNIDSVDVRTGDTDATFSIVLPPPLPRRARTATTGATAITAPLSGTIAEVRVTEGDTVEAGQLLALLEAMKMEHRITAPGKGVVKQVAVRQGDVVREGDLLVELGTA